jgi:hypothetical protein
MSEKMPNLSAEKLIPLVNVGTLVIRSLDLDSPLDRPTLDDLGSKYRELKREIEEFKGKRDEELRGKGGNGSEGVNFRRLVDFERRWMEPPPDDFRSLPIIPTSTELLSGEKAFLRPSLIKGGYASAQEYLDVQYRLLREDFVAPLREGIQQYFKNR